MTAAATPHRHRTLLPYAAALVAVATLGACTGGDPGPSRTTPPASITTSSTPTTTTTAPAPSPTTSLNPVTAKIPAAARTNDRAGATLFSRFYFTELNRSFRTGDSALLAELASTKCITCTAFVDGVNELRDKGRRYGGDLVIVSSANPLKFSESTKQVLLEIDQRAVPVLDKSGAQTETTPPGKATFVASLAFDSGRWTLMRLQKVTS